MEDLAVSTALNHFGSLREFRQVYKKEMYFQDLDHSFSQYEPRNRQITCIYDIIRPSIHLSSMNLFVFCLFVCFSFGRGRRGRYFISYLPYACQLALHLQRHHNALPNSLSL